jgi:hypothetical protein
VILSLFASHAPNPHTGITYCFSKQFSSLSDNTTQIHGKFLVTFYHIWLVIIQFAVSIFGSGYYLHHKKGIPPVLPSIGNIHYTYKYPIHRSHVRQAKRRCDIQAQTLVQELTFHGINP